MRWAVEIGEEFEAEFDALPAQVRNRDSGIIASPRAVRATIGATARRHTQRLSPREYEGVRFSAADGEWEQHSRSTYCLSEEGKEVANVRECP